MAFQHTRCEVVDSGKDDGDAGQDFVAVAQNKVKGGVVQNDGEVDFPVSVFVGQKTLKRFS